MAREDFSRDAACRWKPANALLRVGGILIACLFLMSFHSFCVDAAVPQGSLSGTIVGSDGKPVPGALVAAVPDQGAHPAATTRSSADGTFQFEGLKPGSYGLTATAQGQTAGYLGGLKVVQGKDLSGVKVVLGGDGFILRGTIRDDEGKPVEGAVVLALRYSDLEGDIFQVSTDRQGAYVIKLPNATYQLLAEHPGYESDSRGVSLSEDQSVDLQIVSTVRASAPAPEAVEDWIRAHAVRVSTCAPGYGFSDMMSLEKIIGKARVVALGEATHGTHEFFQFKRRMLEFLVTKMGFTAFAIEASFPESQAVNSYVLSGKGDPAKALSGMYFWTWDTQEILDMIRWMRSYNEDPAHLKKVKFYGFDMQFTQEAVPSVIDYLRKVDPMFAPKAEKALSPLAGSQARLTYPKLPRIEREVTDAAVTDLLKRFDERRSDYIARSSEEAWALARQNIVIISQAKELYVGRLSSIRDRAMANNIEWILDQEGPGGRIMVWAHNRHVSMDGDALYHSVGSILKEDLGEDLCVIGFAFDKGSFQAVDSLVGRGLHGFSVAASPEGTLNAALARARIPLFVLDLRQVPAAGTVGAWWRAKHKERSIGATFNKSSPDLFWWRACPLKEYDALFFVEDTMAARPTPSGRRPPAGSRTRPARSPFNLDLEHGELGKVPTGWFLSQNSLKRGFKAELDLSDDNHRCVLLRRGKLGFGYGTLMQRFDAAPYRGKRVRFEALVRADLVGQNSWVGLWLRVDCKRGTGFFKNMQDRPIRIGKWEAYQVEGNVAPDAESINIGILLDGRGKTWMSAASFEVLGDVAPAGHY